MSPEILVTLISAGTSLLVAGTVGVFTLAKGRRELGAFQAKFMLEQNLIRFVEVRAEFFGNLRDFEKETHALIEEAPGGMNPETAHHVFAFFGDHVRPFLDAHRSLLLTDEIENAESIVLDWFSSQPRTEDGQYDLDPLNVALKATEKLIYAVKAKASSI